MKPARKPLFRSLLLALFLSVKLVVCHVVSGLGAALSLVWSKAAYLRLFSLGCVGMRKVETGALEKARRCAEELLCLSGKLEDDWGQGDAIHKGHLILGRVALREGDLEQAGRHLLGAGNTPGSPGLDSFGPNMTLAKELLEAGESRVVLEYFALCGKFWQLGSGKLAFWTASVEQGRIPNFGSNLLY